MVKTTLSESLKEILFGEWTLFLSQKNIKEIPGKKDLPGLIVTKQKGEMVL